MNSSIHLYHWYRKAIFRAIRLLALFFVSSIVFIDITNGRYLEYSLFFLSIFLMWEVFFRYKISAYHPKISIKENHNKKYENSMTMPALYATTIHSDMKEIIQELIKYKQVQYLLQKAAIATQELKLLSTMQKKDVVEMAAVLSEDSGGKYITTMDIFCAYLLICEKETKLLFDKKIKDYDLFAILKFARSQFSSEENPKKYSVVFDGSGIGEFFVVGWTPETKKYTQDITSTALLKKPLLLGRENEFKTLTQTLMKKDSNNVLLVGERGVGKETIIESLAYESFVGSLHGDLNHHRIYELLTGLLLAGAKERSELEMRLQNIVNEISHAGNVILYIPEFQNIVGASSYGLDISGTLLPYLKGGHMPIVASITGANYKVYMEKSPLLDVFQTILINEPEKDLCIEMLLRKTYQLESSYDVIFSYKSIVAALEHAKHYVQDGALPGSASILLEDTANIFSKTAKSKKIISEEDLIQIVENKTHVTLSAPKKEEKDLLLHLEDKLHERIIDQEDAISAISESMRRLRSGITQQDKPISFLFLGPTGVGKTETAKALAALYYGGEKNMLRFDMSEYSSEDGMKRLLGALPGEGEERGELTEQVRDNPYSLVLLDEFEKANPQILNLFLQVLDDGRLTDNKGNTISFINSIIIATSNAGSEFIRQELDKGVPSDETFQKKLLDHLQKNNIFRPELLNRFDAVIVYKPLGEKEVVEVIKLMLKKVTKKMQDKDITLLFDDTVISKIAKEGMDKQFGARPIERYIQNNIEDLLAQKMLKDEVQRGNTVAFSVGQDYNFTTTVS